MNLTPLRSLSRPAAVASLAKNARSAQVIGRPLDGRDGFNSCRWQGKRLESIAVPTLRHPDAANPIGLVAMQRSGATDGALSHPAENCAHGLLRSYMSLNETLCICDLAKGQVIAYPAKEYIGGLSDRTRQETQRCYDRTVREGSMMLLIRDSEKRILQSYVFHRTERPTKPGRKTGRRSSSPPAAGRE